MVPVVFYPPYPGHQRLHDPLHHEAAVKDIPGLDDCLRLRTVHQSMLRHSGHRFQDSDLLQILGFSVSLTDFNTNRDKMNTFVIRSIMHSLSTSATGC